MGEYVHHISEDESDRIRRFLLWLAVGTCVFAAILIAAIVTANHWLRLISHESERRFIEPYVSWSAESVLPRADAAVQRYVEDLGEQLAGQFELDPDLELTYRVVRGGPINAFAMLGGNIFVFEGLLAAIDNENSLAMVLAHEIAHAQNRDPLLGAGRGMLLQILVSSLSGGGIEPSTVDLGSDLMLNVYSREQETAADRMALAALQGHYGHVGGATDLFVMLRDSSEAPETVDILSTHPDLAMRIEAIDSIAEQYRWAKGPPNPYPPDVREILNGRRQ